MSEPNWTEVKSSNLAAVRYWPSGARLDERFKSGGEFRYDSVPLHVYEELTEAESIGSAFHRLIRAAGYKGSKLDVAPVHEDEDRR